MKKLMIAAAIVCAAAMSQAAKVDWNLTAKDTIMRQDGSAAANLNVYLIDTKASDYAKLVIDLAAGDATEANLSTYAAYLGTAQTGAEGKKQGKFENAAVAEKGSIIAGGDVFAKFLAFDSNSDGDWYYLSIESQGAGYDGSFEFPTGTEIGWNEESYSAGNWKAVSAVPEPTSGLLLLLGVAGLALRRRRA